jgi:hypothetical protein
LNTNSVCMNCRSKGIEQFLDLGRQPNGNSYPEIVEIAEEPTFPFAMAVCMNCWQVQIEQFPSVEKMFSNHPYVTGLNCPVVQHFENLAKITCEKFKIDGNSLVLDIGANDGTLLKIFQALGMRVLGIDPGRRTGKLAKAAGLTVCETFWNETSALAINQLNLQPDLITASAVFYHMEDIHSFIKGLKAVMSEKTIFMAQCVHFLDVLKKFQFDHFYHEHTMIHSVGPLKNLFKIYGLRIIDVDLYDIHGGSFVIYVVKDESPLLTRSSVQEIIKKEFDEGVFEIDSYRVFASRVQENREALVQILRDLSAKGKSIYALGAPLKGSTLLNFCGIGPDLIKFAVEINQFKIGKRIPGTRIPILSEDSIEEAPDYYLILSWNYLEFFKKKYSFFLKNGGKFIIPHPEVSIIDGD